MKHVIEIPGYSRHQFLYLVDQVKAGIEGMLKQLVGRRALLCRDTLRITIEVVPTKQTPV